ncbi:hypothetical protein [Brevibacterium sp. HMSC07C04]|uniref:hypothetical protein n=1 Tax=Brevibacterium sp. HMSC07C04 TaxID=1581130 RepID=UPI0008A1F5E4|nr:hypothetical protein [Brevibacterium sp. HMSC07C04]OFS26871.1 hypothetical protein HMPREF3162_04165 [Brevibacterium sp. HMSC07C04]
MFDRFTARLLAFAAVVFAPAAPRRRRSDRGDVPGWVLITVMTAALVVGLWALAGEAFTSFFQDAMNKVRSAG